MSKLPYWWTGLSWNSSKPRGMSYFCYGCQCDKWMNDVQMDGKNCLGEVVIVLCITCHRKIQQKKPILLNFGTNHEVPTLGFNM